jgi:nucleoside-diphosphate-sugar epimerase/putative sterol carrier protein
MSTRARAPKLNVVTTGAAGQLGAHILRRLIDDRSIGRIVAIDRVVPSAISAKMTFVSADVRDPEVGKYFEGADVLIHLAFIVTSHLPRAEFDAINVDGSKNVFTAAARAGVKQILYASSVAAYGIAPGLPDPLTEDVPRRLVDDFPYSASKFRVEEYLDDFERAHPEVAVARFRPSVLIGARLNNPLGQLFARSLANGLVIGASGAELPVVWDEDVADAFMLALKRQARGAYNLSSDEPVDLKTLAKETGLRHLPLSPMVARFLPSMSRLTARKNGGAIDPAWQKHANVVVRPSSEKAKRELGWAPKYPTALAVMKHHLEEAHGRIDPRIFAFLSVIGFAASHAPPDPEAAGLDAIVHLAITGKGGADYTILVKERKISIARGIPRPPTSAATMDVTTFRELMSGKLSYPTAQVTGRIRFDGDVSAGFVVASLLARFHTEAQANNLRGRAVRTFARFLSEGAAR